MNIDKVINNILKKKKNIKIDKSSLNDSITDVSGLGMQIIQGNINQPKDMKDKV